jgi:hypothetical protein
MRLGFGPFGMTAEFNVVSLIAFVFL